MKLKIYVDTATEYVMNKLEDNFFRVWIVGGAIRDKLKARLVHDYDLVTDATPTEIKELFADSVLSGNEVKYGVSFINYDHELVELATLREDVSRGRHPKVSFTDSIEKDSWRRDFTINALYWERNSENLLGEGTVHDPTGMGLSDLKEGILRFILNGKDRIEEDPLRILRAARFYVMGWDMDANVVENIFDKVFTMELMNDLKVERIREEIVKMMSVDVRKSIFVLEKIGIVDMFIEEWSQMINYDQNTPYHKYKLDEHSIVAAEYLQKRGYDFLMVWVALFHDIGKVASVTVKNYVNHYYGHEDVGADIMEGVMKKLKFSNKEIKKAVFMISNHMNLHQKHTLKSFMKMGYQLDVSGYEDRDIMGLYLADLWASRDEISYLEIDYKFPRIAVKYSSKKLISVIDEIVGKRYDKKLIGIVIERVREFYFDHPNISVISLDKKVRNYVRSICDV